MRASGSRKRKKKKKKKSASAAVVSPTDTVVESGSSPKGNGAFQSGSDRREMDDQDTTMNLLIEAFSSYSLERVKSAYQEAEGDPVKTAEILLASPADSTISEVSNARPSMSSRRGHKRKQKKVVASTGLVANAISKEYAGSFSAQRGKKDDFSKPKGYWNSCSSREDAEDFLCSMLGGTCELDPAVVKDVLDHSGLDVEKALDTLLDMCNSARTSDYINLGHAIGNEPEHELPWKYSQRDCVENCTYTVVKGLLDSLFNAPSTSKQESSSMNWRKALKNFETFSQGFEFPPMTASESSMNLQNGKMGGDDSFRSAAGQHWSTMNSYFQQAAVAYSKGDGAHASYLSEKGKFHRKLAQVADEKASQEIFEARNKDIRNSVTIDLHGQHVKQAIRLVKVHLLMLTYVPSIKFLRVITGCGKGRLKQSATNLLKKEGISWSEENPGTLVIRVDRSRKYSFMDVDSDED